MMATPPQNTPGDARVCVSVLVHYPTVVDPCGSVPVRREPLRWSRVGIPLCRNQGCVYKDVLAVFLNGKWPLKMLPMEQWPSAPSRATGGPWRRPNGQWPAARFSLRTGELYLLRNPIWSLFDQSGFFYTHLESSCIWRGQPKAPLLGKRASTSNPPGPRRRYAPGLSSEEAGPPCSDVVWSLLTRDE